MEGLQILEQKVNYKGLINSIDIKPDEFLLPLHEVIVNSIQSIEDRIEPTEKGSIIIKVHRNFQAKLNLNDEVEEYHPISGFTIIDNGVGFTNKRETAFSTPFTNFNYAKGGKGMGRYTVLACFGSMDIESSFLDGDEFFERKYRFDNAIGLQKYPESKSFGKSGFENKTIIKLNNFLPEYYEFARRSKITIKEIADNIIQHCLLFFIGSEKSPVIRILYDEDKIENAIVLNDIYKTVIEIEKTEKDIVVENVSKPFKLSYVRNYNGVHSHSIHLCANKREVGKKQSLTNYLPSFKELYNSDEKKYHLSIYVESVFLDEKNHPQRNKFMLPENSSKKNDYDEISLDELFKDLSEKIRENYSEYIEEAEKEKNNRIEKYILNPSKPRLRYRHLLNVKDAFLDIPINASDETLEAKLHEKEFRLEQKREKVFEKVFKKREYDKEEFGNIVSSILKEEAAFSKDKLADLMIKRKSVIKLFQKYLEWRDEGNFMLEEDLHNIIFTMGAETDNMPSEYHNLWLLDERFTFHTYTASDIKTKSNKNFESLGNKEPDVLIYDVPWAYSDNLDKINSLVVFEFKKPGKEFANTTKLDDLVMKYFQDLMQSKARSQKGNLLNIEDSTPKFGYIICELNKDLVEHNIKWNGFKKTAHGHLYKVIPELNLHIEVMNYEQMLDFSQKRHHAFFKTLGIDNV
ncbi:hypothetical protein [Flavobacterium covae]|uniref:hypothetical protein n=1 Tax=Flavobacterium covae TaxID=2906076 RepID=UPI000745CC2C|nr:hypothetical protein [Flavobacterium covae]AMA49982.1 hypothetical protein AWN65_11195 [Flavobacterium covae]MCJ1808602.1 hypothetical protein [Flavobacterium covae]